MLCSKALLPQASKNKKLDGFEPIDWSGVSK